MGDRGNSFSKTNTATFALSKDLTVPIQVKIGYLQCTKDDPSQLRTLSEKFEHPSVFKSLSQVHKNSDLFVSVAVYDGANNNLISIPVQTPYKSLSSTRRTWNSYLDLAYSYSQLSIDSYLKIIIYELVDTRSVIFGTGYLSLFNKKTSTLRKGAQKIPIYQNEKRERVEYGDISGLTKLEGLLIGYENGDYPHVKWLDKLSMARIKRENEVNEDHDYYLYLELPNFELPVVYSSITFKGSEESYVSEDYVRETFTSSLIINSIDIPMTKGGTHQLSRIRNGNGSETNESSTAITLENDLVKNSPYNLKVYDPDFHASFFNNSQLPTGTHDPIELKYNKLERDIHNNSILDKELKPSPQERDELLRILTKPSNIELNELEKNLIWKFRYFFSKNNSIGGGAGGVGGEAAKGNITTTKSFFPRFLKSINWNNDNELNHVFEDIVPNYWSVDKLQIGDALELLSSYFNPYTLCSMPLVQGESELQGRKTQAQGQGQNDFERAGANGKSRNGRQSEESKAFKIFKYVTFLRRLAVDRLKLASNEELLLYLLQLVQALKYEALIYKAELPQNDNSSSHNSKKSSEDNSLLKSPLAIFLIEKSVQNDKLGNFFYWYVKVENEDQLSQAAQLAHMNGTGKISSIYTTILNRFIESLNKYSESKRLPYYKHLKSQISFIKKLTKLVEEIRTEFKKNESTLKKREYLKKYLSESSNGLLKFSEPFPLPLDPSIIVYGCYPEESSVFKSSLSPLKITLKTLNPRHSSSSQLFGKKHHKYGKYPLMFKIGDDLRQDQLVIQIINLMDQLLKNENLDLRLTPYKILATSPIAGLIQFVPNETLDTILGRNYPDANGGETAGGILNYLRSSESDEGERDSVSSSQDDSNRSVIGVGVQDRSVLGSNGSRTGLNRESISQSIEESHPVISSDLGVSGTLMDNYVKSCAGYCVITYLLGVGDRHLDNLLLSPNGKFWHADFGYILGRDPKPFPPLMKLPIQVIDGMGGLDHENFNIFKSYCFITYTALRKNSNLILNLFQLMLDANIPDIKIDPKRAIEKVQEKFCLEMTEEEAILHFQNLINDSVNAFLPVVIDRLHSLAQYWRA